MPATPSWLAAIEAMLNRSIASQARGLALARRLEGKSLQIDVEGLLRLRATCVGARLALSLGDDAAADAALAGSLAALLRLVTTDAAQAAGAGSVQVRGDAETAGAYRELLQLARPDLEEEVAHVLGDLTARRAGNFARAAVKWVRQAGRTFGENLAEYLQEESRDVVSKPELEEFLRAVDTLREAADRLDARIGVLERRPQDLRRGAAP